MKLSKAQQAVMDEAKKDIDIARSLDYPEWLKKTNSYYQVPSTASDDYKEMIEQKFIEAVDNGELKEYWERAINGIVLTHCNSRTLAKLQEYGLIEIIRDSSGETFGIDTIKVLNY